MTEARRPPHTTGRDRGCLAALLFVALLARGTAVALTHDAFARDTDNYGQLAQALRADGLFGFDGRPTAFRPPLYPGLLAPLTAWPGQERLLIGGLHALLGAGTTWLAWRLARRWQLGRAGWCAALWVACDPLLVYQSTQLMTETLATFLALAGLAAVDWASERRTARSALLAGCLVGLTGLCRPTFYPWAATLALLWLVQREQRWRRCGAFALGAGLVVAPWAIRNAVVFGRPILTTTHGGYTLLLAHNPDYYAYLQRGLFQAEPWTSTALDAELRVSLGPVHTPQDELRIDAAQRAQALAAMRADPAGCGRAVLAHAKDFWSPLPHRRGATEAQTATGLRWAVALGYTALYGLALFGLLRHRTLRQRPGWQAGALLALTLALVHGVYFSNQRMRAPLLPWLALTAAAAIPRRQPADDSPS